MEQRELEKNKLLCRYCGSTLYALDENESELYVCESCGKTFDREQLFTGRNAVQGKDKNKMFKLFNNRFMKKYTSFENFYDFINHCPLTDLMNGDLFNESIPFKYPRKWNKYVKKNTQFSCWDEMFEKAVECLLHI
jgi:DNA-directed RNA polymerase subunit M/transcription elongation factor TFIIS